LDIKSDAKLFLPYQSMVTVEGELTNEAGTDGLELLSEEEGMASLIQKSAGVGATAHIYMEGNKWHNVSSPAPGQAIAAFLAGNTSIPTKNVAGTDRRGMYGYLEADNDWGEFFLDAGQPGSLESGTGFGLRTSANATAKFTGTLEGGEPVINLTKTGYGWNSIGNPYPSSLNANEAADISNNLLTVNTDALDPCYVALYVWDEQPGFTHKRNDYKIINQSGGTVPGNETLLAQNYLPAGQGFMVRAKEDGAAFSFTHAMQTHIPGGLALKSGGASDWVVLKLTAKNTVASGSTVLKFNDRMTAGLDPGYDAGILKGGKGVELFTQLLDNNGNQFALQCLPLQNIESLEIPVGVDVAAGGDFVFSIQTDNFPVGIIPVLNDKHTGDQMSFTAENSEYKATIANNTRGFGRFTITFSTTTAVDDVLAGQQHFKAWYGNGAINITGQIQGNAQAAVYDMNGRQLGIHQLNTSAQNQILMPIGATGVYLVKIKDAARSEVLKVAVSGK
jgi:hypothetical protein